MPKQMQDIVIRISGDVKDLQPTLEQLAKLGKVDSDNAKKFRENSKKNQDSLKETGGVLKKVGDQFTDIGTKIIAAFAVEQVIEFGASCVKEFAAAEQGALKLNAALSAQGGTQAQFKALIEQSEKLQKTSIFSDEAVQSAQALALQYGLTADVVKDKVIPAVSDYASATGKDLNEALQDVLRGLNGNMRALKLYGVEAKATGDKAFDLDNIVGQLNDKFKGQSTIIAGSTSGTIQRLGNLWSEVKEAIGGALVNMVTFPQAVLQVNAEIDDIQKAGNDRLKKKLTELTEAYNKAVQEGSASAFSLSLQITQIQSELTEREVEQQKKRNKVILNLKKEFSSMSLEQLEFESQGENVIRAKYANEELEDRKKASEKLKQERQKALDDLKKKEQEHVDFVRSALDQELKYRIESLNGRDEAEKKIAIESIRTRIALGVASREEIDALYDYEEKRMKENVEAQREAFEEKQEAQDQFTEYRIESLNNADKEERRIAIQAIKDRIALGTATKEEIDALAEYQKKVNDSMKEQMQSVLENVDQIFDELADRRDANLQSQIDLEKSFIDNQTRLAIAGMDNTLGIEEKKLAELEKKRAQNQRKLKREKELEAFFEAVISYNKEDPKTSIIKALAQVAGIEGAAALFMEDAGLIGSGNIPMTKLTGKGWSRRHKSRKDRLVLAEDGEGMFSKKNIANMGGPERFLSLKRRLDAGPLGEERRIPIEKALPAASQHKEVVESIQQLTQVIKDKSEISVDWESKADMDSMNITRIEKGIKNLTQIQLRKPRIG